MSRAACPDCRKVDQMTYGPGGGPGRFFVGCVRCQNAKDYPTFSAMWRALAQPPAPHAQPTLFEAAS